MVNGAWLSVLSPWIWPTIYAVLCFVMAMGRGWSAFVFYPAAILFTVYSLISIRPIFPTVVLETLHYDSMFFWGGLLLSLLFLVVGLMGYRSIHRPERWGLLLLLYLSALVVTATGNLLLLFVGLEMFFLIMVLWLAFFNHGQAQTGMIIRLLLNGAFATSFTVFGMAFLYGVCGSLDYSEIGLWSSQQPSLLYGFGLLFFLVGIFFKLSVVPFQHWTAEVYHDSGYPGLMVLATISKTVGVLILLKLFYHLPIPSQLLLILAGLTMTVGNFAALAQRNVKRLIAFSSIAHVGFILMGIGSGNLDGFQAVASYLLFYCLTLAVLLTLLMMVHSETDNLEEYNGLAQRHPLLATVLGFLLLSLAGIPPTLGFLAKWKIFEAAFQSQHIGIIAVAALNSVVAATYYLSWGFRLFMREGGTADWPSERQVVHTLMALLLLLFMIALSLYPSWLFQLSRPLLAGII